ncbi:MAG: hypothetical protein H0X29_05115 [Parachlamydiaceae bacterium]|nr:hypothetical protein [Parachlamydiaceae bacterium]
MVTPTPVGPVDPVDTTSLAPGKYTKTIILNRVFDLILKMLATMQNVATVQANRLTFLTQWQKSYTDVMNQIKIFSKGDATINPNYADTTLADINRTNAQYTETLRNKRSVISDDAKSLQSNVNQSNDAVNQQSTIGTSILQELATILSAIFR